MHIKKEGELSRAIPIKEGVLQDEILSSPLFALFIADFEQFLRSRRRRGITTSLLVDILALAYADDIAVLSESSSGIKTILKALWDDNRINRHSINIRKTKIVIFKKGSREMNNLKFYFGDNEIEIVRKYVYLGIPFNSMRGQSSKAPKTGEICHKRL